MESLRKFCAKMINIDQVHLSIRLLHFSVGRHVGRPVNGANNSISGISDQANILFNDSAKRYKYKIAELGLKIDFFSLNDCIFDVLIAETALNHIPCISYPDMYHYLIEYPDHYILAQSFESL